MQTATENKVIPKLRFSEFNEEWEIIRLQDLAIRITEKNRDDKIQTVLTNSATKGIVSQADYFDRNIANKNNLDGYYIVNIGDYVYNPRISKFAPVGPLKKNNLVLGLMSPIYSVFRFNTNEDEFFENYFETTAWHKYMKSVANYGVRHDRMNISNSDFFKMPIPIPSLAEQQKIASFVSKVDKKFQQLIKKKELLEAYKKGVMQKIFSQELRFKDDNGNNYPDWEVKNLGELCDITTGKLDANAMVKGGQYRFYTCAKDYYQIDRYKFDTDALIISGNGANVGYVHHFNGKFNAYQRTYVLDNFEDSIYYLRHFLDRHLYKRIFREKKDGATPYIIMSTLSDMIISLPTLDEQKKIANFLSYLDIKIELVSTQIENTQSFKKGLLQQMFV